MSFKLLGLRRRKQQKDDRKRKKKKEKKEEREKEKEEEGQERNSYTRYICIIVSVCLLATPKFKTEIIHLVSVL